MVQECAVILNNSEVTVARFGNIEVQFPSIHKKAQTVFVKYEDGNYFIVEKPVEEKIDIKEKPVKSETKKRNKKTTNENTGRYAEISCI